MSDSIDARKTGLERDAENWGADPTTGRARLALRGAQRLVLITSRTPLRHAWALAYRRPPHRPSGVQERRIAAWLELLEAVARARGRPQLADAPARGRPAP